MRPLVDRRRPPNGNPWRSTSLDSSVAVGVAATFRRQQNTWARWGIRPAATLPANQVRHPCKTPPPHGLALAPGCTGSALPWLRATLAPRHAGSDLPDSSLSWPCGDRLSPYVFSVSQKYQTIQTTASTAPRSTRSTSSGSPLTVVPPPHRASAELPSRHQVRLRPPRRRLRSRAIQHRLRSCQTRPRPAALWPLRLRPPPGTPPRFAGGARTARGPRARRSGGGWRWSPPSRS